MRTKQIFLFALLASAQAITLNKKDDDAKPAPEEKDKKKCETNSDGITFCLSPGGQEWTVDMNHIDKTKKKY